MEHCGTVWIMLEHSTLCASLCFRGVLEPRLFQRVLVCFHFFSDIVILGLTLDKGENVPLHQGDLVTRHDGRPWEIRLQSGRLAARERCSVHDEVVSLPSNVARPV